jgi:hypothetical protein
VAGQDGHLAKAAVARLAAGTRCMQAVSSSTRPGTHQVGITWPMLQSSKRLQPCGPAAHQLQHTQIKPSSPPAPPLHTTLGCTVLPATSGISIMAAAHPAQQRRTAAAQPAQAAAQPAQAAAQPAQPTCGSLASFCTNQDQPEPGKPLPYRVLLMEGGWRGSAAPLPQSTCGAERGEGMLPGSPPGPPQLVLKHATASVVAAESHSAAGLARPAPPRCAGTHAV